MGQAQSIGGCLSDFLDGCGGSIGDTIAVRRLWLAIVIVTITIITFAQVRHAAFVNYDDFEFVIENPHVSTGLTAANVRWAFTHPYDATGGPLTWLSHMADVEWAGLDAGAHHITSLLLHTVNALLLFVVLARITGAEGRSAVAAALFAVHPLHVESVAWVAERKDVLSTLFWIAGIGAYAAYARRPSAARYIAVAAMLILGLLSKPMVATLPIVLLLLDVWPLRRLRLETRDLRTAARLIAEKTPLIVLSFAAGVLTLRSQSAFESVVGVEQLPLSMRVANALISVWAYIGKMAWPSELVPFYPYRTDLSSAAVVAAAIGVLVVSAAAIRLARRAPYLIVGWFWYLIALLPVLGLIQVGAHAMADRFTYVPLVGLFVVLSWGSLDLLRGVRAPAWLPGAVATAAVTVGAWVAHEQVQHWRDGVALWTHTVRVQPDNARAHANLGVALTTAGDARAANEHYREALRLDPNDGRSHNNLGLALSAEGRTDEAIVHYREAVRLDPEYTNARINLANLLDERGQTGEAIEHYRLALTRDPDNVLARANYAIALAKSRRLDEALPEMLSVIERDPGKASWRFLAAMMSLDLGRPADARRHLEETLRLDPRHEDARRVLADLK
jgi:tetratricopeptide (TPR) repeat protein